MERDDMASAVLTAVAVLLVVAGVATWTVGGALVTAGVLLAVYAQLFRFDVVDDEAGDL